MNFIPNNEGWKDGRKTPPDLVELFQAFQSGGLVHLPALSNERFNLDQHTKIKHPIPGWPWAFRQHEPETRGHVPSVDSNYTHGDAWLCYQFDTPEPGIPHRNKAAQVMFCMDGARWALTQMNHGVLGACALLCRWLWLIEQIEPKYGQADGKSILAWAKSRAAWIAGELEPTIHKARLAAFDPVI